MKVLYILDSLNRGGAETLILDICRNGRRCGLDASVVATGGGELEDEFRSSGIPFHQILRRSALDRELIRNLRELIRSGSFDVIHAQQPVEAIHGLLALRGVAAAPKLILSHHIAAKSNLKNRLTTRYLVPRVAINLAVSQHVLDWALRTMPFAHKAKWKVVANGVDLARLQPSARGAGIRTELAISETAPLLGMVGNFYSGDRKDQLTVCRALSQVFAAQPAAQFLFVGDTGSDGGRMYNECLALCNDSGIAERVHFTGKRSDVADVLQALDVFVFSSRAEGMPVAVIEAMAAGLPTVLSDIEPLREVTDGGRVARLFRTGDPSDLAEKILELLSDPKESELLGQAAHEWAVQEYSIDAHIRRLYDVYAGLI